MKKLTSFLNHTTMYRIVLYGLGLIAVSAFVLSVLGILSVNPLGLVESLALLLAACWVTDRVFARLYSSTTSVESIWITSMILFLTLAPPTSVAEALVIMLAGAIAITSKYVLSVNRKHVFNPAAIALVVLSLCGSGLASWWVGSPFLLPVVAVVGFAIVRKIHRFDVLWAFIATSIGVTLLLATQGQPMLSVLSTLLLSGPLVFFSTIMLTEPLTMPPSRPLRIIYGVIVGGLYASQFHFGILYATPHLALILGNTYSYIVSSRQKLSLKLRSVEQLSANVYEFVFRPDQKLAFAAGQYLEWTLPHASPDSGGNRRYFTIASSPTERDLRVGVRIDEQASTFKQAMLSMREGDAVIATSLAGDFVLPRDTSKKLLFIAGGVGITPFVSMLRYLIDKQDKRDIILFYIASSPADLAYRTVIEEARRVLNLRAIPVTGKRIDREMLQTQVPDLTERKCYISGPESMVTAYKFLMSDIGVPRRNIRTDHFTGFSGI